MSKTHDRFWDLICLFSRQAYVLLAVSAGLLFFMAFSWVYTEPGSEPRAIIRLNLIILVVNVVVLVSIIHFCRSRDL